MDFAMTRSVMTLVMLLVFVGITVWAWSGRQRDRFDAAARVPFEDEPDSTRGRPNGEHDA